MHAFSSLFCGGGAIMRTPVRLALGFSSFPLESGGVDTAELTVLHPSGARLPRSNQGVPDVAAHVAPDDR
jgi:hypothetical protein